MNSIQELQRLLYDHCGVKYPHLPEPAVCPIKYSERTINGQTRCMIDIIRQSGGHATRVSKTVHYKPTITKWTPVTPIKGFCDIMAIPQGTNLSIRVRIDLNRQPDSREKVEQPVNAASGIYYLARDFQSFFDWIKGIKKEGAAAKQTPIS